MTKHAEYATTSTDGQTPIDLNGAEQHHNLKNQPGRDGDPDHASGEPASKDMKAAIAKGDDAAQVGQALKRSAKSRTPPRRGKTTDHST